MKYLNEGTSTGGSRPARSAAATLSLLEGNAFLTTTVAKNGSKGDLKVVKAFLGVALRAKKEALSDPSPLSNVVGYCYDLSLGKAIKHTNAIARRIPS